MNYDEYLAKLPELQNDLNNTRTAKYQLVQNLKQLPYKELSQTQEFIDYRNNHSISPWVDDIDANIKDISDANLQDEAIEIQYMRDFLRETRGEEAVDAYNDAIEDKLNRINGRIEADEFLASITDGNGEIDYNAWNTLRTGGKGVLMGIENFGEGIVNVFTSEAMISDNQYAQMYILEAISNTSGAYINQLAQTILEEKGDEAATEFINNMIDVTTGEINLDYAKNILTEEEYTKLEYKVKKDKETILDDAFQLGISFGNMLPSMALTLVLSSSGAAPAATSLVGNVLMGMSAGGNAKNQALIQGSSLASANLYGLCSGLSETGLGYLIGNIPFLNTKANLSFRGIFKEGAEEFLQEYVDAGLRSIILGETINLDELSQDAIKSFVYGALISFGTNTAVMGSKLIINGKSVELNNLADFKAFFQILNNSGILIGDRTGDGVGKTIIIDENIANKSEMIDLMKSIYKDAEIFITTENGNVSYAGYSGYDAGSDSDVAIDNSLGHIGLQFFARKENTTNNNAAYNDLIAGMGDYDSNFGSVNTRYDPYNYLITGMEVHDAKYGQGSAINELYNYLYNGGDINRLSRSGGFRDFVSNLSRNNINELRSYYNIIAGIYNNFGTYRSTISGSTNTMIKNLEQEILSNLPNADDLTKARYLYLELSKRLSYDVNYVVGDNASRYNIYNKNLNFANLDTNSVICKGWSELYAQLLIDAGFPPETVKICGSEKNGGHRWVEIMFNDYIIRCDATDVFNHSTDLANTKSGSSTNGFIALDKGYSGVRITDNVLNGMQIDSTWLRNIDQNLGYITAKKYFNEMSEELTKQFYSPGLVEKIFGVNKDKLLDAKMQKMLDIDIPENMKSYEAYAYFQSLKHMLFTNVETQDLVLGLYYREISPNNYSGMVIISKYTPSGITCRIIDDYNGSSIVNFKNMYEYTDYFKNNGIFGARR